MEIVNRKDFIVKHGGKVIVFLLPVLILVATISLIMASNPSCSCQHSELDDNNVKFNKRYPRRNNTKTIMIKIEEQNGVNPFHQYLQQKSKCRKAHKSFERLGDNIRGKNMTYFPFISRIVKLINLYKPEEENIQASLQAVRSFTIQLYDNIDRNKNNQEALQMYLNLLSQFQTSMKEIKEKSMKSPNKDVNITQVLYNDLEAYQSDLRRVEKNYRECNENSGKNAKISRIKIYLDANADKKASYYQYFMKLKQTIKVIKFDFTSRLKCEHVDSLASRL